LKDVESKKSVFCICFIVSKNVQALIRDSYVSLNKPGFPDYVIYYHGDTSKLSM